MTRVVGRPTPRVEGELKVTGKALYSADLNLPGTLWGKVLRSPIPYGRIKSIDISKARRVPGVKAVITGQDVTGLRIGRCIYDTPVLADGVVRFIGEKVAAVAAETEEAAEQALDLIEVEYDELEPLFDPVGSGQARRAGIASRSAFLQRAAGSRRKAQQRVCLSQVGQRGHRSRL